MWLTFEQQDDQLVSHHATQGVKVDSTTEELLSTDEGATQSTSEDVSPSKVVTESGPSKALVSCVVLLRRIVHLIYLYVLGFSG